MSQRRLTQQEFGSTLWRAIVPPLLLLAGHAVLLSLLLLYWVRATDWVRHSEQVIGGGYDLERLLANMESGFRGYLLTDEPAFLEPFDKARGRIDLAFREQSERVAGDAAQTKRLDDVRALYQRWLASETFEGQPLTAARREQARLLGAMEQRKRMMDSMRQGLGEMIRVESERKSDRYESERRATTAGIVGGIGLSVLIGIALALINRLGRVLDLSSIYQSALDEEASSSRQFLDLAESIPQLIWIADGGGKNLYFNAPWTDFTSRTIQDLFSQGWRVSVHADDQPGILEKWEQSLKSGKPFEGEFRLKRGRDGAYRWFLCRALPVRDKSGRPARWFGSCTDIEAQKQVGRERESMLAAEQRARGDLIRAARVKDEFLATLSHELRTPMTAILGWARILRDPKVRANNLDRAIEAIDSNAKAQARLIDDLLDMSRIMSGKLAITPERVELRKVIRGAIDSIGPAAANKKINLHLALDGKEELIVNGDPARLQQVVWNLLNNAVKFTPSGGTITVRLLSNNEQAQLVVSDTGVGIDPVFLPHVFERFRQADGSTTRQHGGLGLGLAIVKSVVEMHGGTVEVTSDGANRGATFTVSIPLADASVNGMSDQILALHGRAEKNVLRGRRVLIVDDDDGAVEVMRLILEQSGGVVAVARSGALALEHFRASAVDLVISDIGMPEMDGYALMRAIRAIERDGAATRVPAIALTAFARHEDRDAAIGAGYDLHLTKPLEPEDLLAAVVVVLHPQS